MKNVLFIGGFYPKKLRSTVNQNSCGKVGFSNHNFELAILNGLSNLNDINLFALTAPKVYSYPYNNKAFFTRSEAYIEGKCSIRSIGFCNLFIINKISLLLSLFFNLLYCFRKIKSHKIYVILDTPNIYMETALLLAKSITRKRLETILIIPDIPSFVSNMDKMHIIKRKIVNLFDSFALVLAQKFDHYVLLTSQMQEFFAKRIDYIIMEGIINENLCREGKVFENNMKNGKSEKQIILYTGTLRKIFGVLNLVEAFEIGDFENAELWICGSGDASDEIMESAKRNSNIKFFGLVNSDEAIRLQQKATILVNPRTSEGEFTKYSFPSKTMEYLMTGKPVIANKLPGIPEEYFNYLFIPKDESISSLKDMISYVLNMDLENRNKYSLKGREFVLNNKNSIVQAKRIIGLFKND